MTSSSIFHSWATPWSAPIPCLTPLFPCLPSPPVCVCFSYLHTDSGGRTPSREAKQVMFSDGIRPGGDLTEPARPAGQRSAGADPELRRPPHRRTARLARGSDRSREYHGGQRVGWGGGPPGGWSGGQIGHVSTMGVRGWGGEGNRPAGQGSDLPRVLWGSEGGVGWGGGPPGWSGGQIRHVSRGYHGN